MSSLRVAFLTDYLANLSGTESSIVATCQMLRAAGDDVVVFCHAAEGTVHQYWRDMLSIAGVILIDRPAVAYPAGVTVEAFCKSVAEFLRSWDPDVIHAIPLGGCGLAWVRSRLLPNVPCIGTEMSAASPQCFWYDHATFSAYAHYDAIIATCYRVRDGIRDFFGFPGRVGVIPTLVPVPTDQSTPLTNQDLTHLKSLGSISRLRVEKGPEFMVAALALLRTAHPELTLTVYGETPEIERTWQVAQALGVADRLFLPGPFKGATEIDQVIRRHCVFLLPSLFEGFPLSLLELLARGRVVVATDVGGVSEILASTSAGIVVPAGNSQALAEAVTSLLADPTALIARGETGLKKFRECYDVNVVFPVLRNFYLMVAKDHSHLNRFNE